VRLVRGMWGVSKAAYALFETDNLLIGQGVGLGNDRDQINLGVQAAHELDIDLLESVQVKDKYTT